MRKKMLSAGVLFMLSSGAWAQAPVPPILPAPPPPPVEADAPPMPVEDDYGAFLKRNPGVKSLHFRERNGILTTVVRLKTGKEELYTSASFGNAEKKYGKFPAPPPPPPSLPPPPPPPAPPLDQ